MLISLIVAAADDHAIGKDNQLPWHLPEDLKFFKRTTLGKPVLMGRKTYESLGKPLPGRLNIVISRNSDLSLPEGVLLYDNLQDGINRMQQEDCDEGFIIGGGKIFEMSMDVADRLYITNVHTKVPDADAYFPQVDHSHWKLEWEEAHKADEKHAYDYTFRKYDRIDL
jgi:dihydrofolate reductase